MPGNTYTYVGPVSSAVAPSAADWSPSLPAGESGPGSGSSAIFNGGTVLLDDAALQANTVYLDGGTLVFLGDGGTSVQWAPTLDQASTITTDAAEAETVSGAPQNATIDAFGNFINEGTIDADGPAGSTLTIDIAGTTINGTYVPGTFVNYGEIEVAPGNTLDIAIGATSDLLNAGVIDVDGGYLDIDVAANAANAGYAGVADVAMVSDGGTLETNAFYLYDASASATAPFYVFADSTQGNTIKIDNLGSFGGRFLDFGVNDTIDLGTSLTVTSLVYSASTGLLYLEDNGTILDTLLFVSGNYNGGTLSGTIGYGTTATAGTFGLTLGADGDTELVTSAQNDVYDNTSGTWQTGASWSTGTPGTLDTTVIGLGSQAAFTLATGDTPVSTGAVTLADPNASLQITSPTTINDYGIQTFGGTLDITAGNTLTVPLLRTMGGTVEVDSGAVLDATGHATYGSLSGVYFGSVNGTLDVSNSSTSAVVIDGGLMLVDGGTIDSGGTFNAATSSYADGGAFFIGYEGSGTPAQVIVEATGTQHAVVTDTFTDIGSDTGSYGELTLDGDVSWTDVGDSNDPVARGYMDVGIDTFAGQYPPGTAPAPAGTAQLLVENGAILTDPDEAGIGLDPDSAGSVTIESGGVWNIASNSANGLGIGYDGSGTLDVLNGGTVMVGGDGISTGHSIEGEGTLVVNDALLTDGSGFGDGLAGQGYVQVLNGGTIALTGTGGITVGESAGSSGTLIIGDATAAAAALLSIAAIGRGITVGDLGTGTMEVLSNGTFDMAGTTGIIVGDPAGGSLLVSGPGALVEDGSLSTGVGIGLAGPGLLTIQNGGTVLVAGKGVSAGKSLGATGTISVSDGALIDQNGSDGLYIGQAGAGTLDIGLAGTVAITAQLEIAESGGSGTVSLAGGTLIASGGIEAGLNGEAILSVGSGGTVDTGFLSMNGTPGSPQDSAPSLVALTSGGHLQDTGALAVWQGSTLSVDSQSGIDVGTSGSYVAGAINVEAGQSLAGNGLIAASVVNQGQIEALSGTGTLDIQGSVTGSGTIDVGAYAALRLNGSVGTGQVFLFSSAGPSELILNAPGTGLGNTLDGVTDGDTIEFGGGMTITGAAMVNGNTMVLDYNASGGGSGTYELTDVGFAPGVAPHLVWGVDAVTGDSYVGQVLCFLPGTLISTPSGEIPVERLSVGDRVMTVGGQARAVVWIGQGQVLATRGRRDAATPVIVRKGAFAPNVPHSDLRVTKGHSFLFDGVLIPVEFLVNHRSILWDDRAQEVSLYHVELETHDVLLANGAPAESYRDDGNRWLFRNANSGWDQAPKPPCAPVLTGGEVVDAVWRRLLDGAGPRPSVPLTEEADLHLVVDGVRVEGARLDGDVALFTLEAGARSVRLVSRAAVPQELGIARDARCLGAAVRRIVARKGTRFRVIRAEDAALAEGFYPFEAGLGWRWTNGDARVPAGLFAGFEGEVELVVQLGGRTLYVDDGRARHVA
ncbi:MAG TPA: Hint domain-containing protein [Rhodopila sp.]|nr:Hint domain-containing protein [Rhodopila sp.]